MLSLLSDLWSFGILMLGREIGKSFFLVNEAFTDADRFLSKAILGASILVKLASESPNFYLLLLFASSSIRVDFLLVVEVEA